MLCDDVGALLVDRIVEDLECERTLVALQTEIKLDVLIFVKPKRTSATYSGEDRGDAIGDRHVPSEVRLVREETVRG